MMRFSALILLFTLLPAEEKTEDIAAWSQYARGGLTYDQNVNGGHIYFRIKRVTSNTFRDLRMFSYDLGDDSYIYLRYKSSVKYSHLGRLYNFTTVSFQKNTRAELDLRYHFNQGLGYFISDHKNGHINTELGQAYDMSDYLNDTRKTSYIKSGVFWDQSIQDASIKLEAEWFKQISEIVEADLSRFQFLLELSYHINNHLAFIIGFEQDYYTEYNEHTQSYYISLGWKR